jgi:23S rRNA pseudouridine2605 synthase
MTRQRLQKLMASCGIGSRRACEELILQGRVEVDGDVVTELGTQVDPEAQSVRCDGELLRVEPQLYYLLNKPRGAICSDAGRKDRPRAIDFLPAKARDRRLFTIGRLDVDSEGALILTNDGELCHLVSHPRFGIHKTYRVEIDGVPDDATMEKMRKGVWLSEGRTGPARIVMGRTTRERAVLEITVREGKKREIRRLCARFGHEVRKLTRTAIGPVALGALSAGEIRPLTPAEIAALRESADVVIRLGGGLRAAPGAAPRRSADARRRTARRPSDRPSSGPGPKPGSKPGPGRGRRSRG